jgi:hypothetical protein
MINALLVDNLLLYNNGVVLRNFGLFSSDVLPLVIGVALYVELNQGLELANFVLESVFILNHFLLGVIGLELALFDLFFERGDFVELLLLVAELSALGGNEKVLGGGEVELEFVVLLLLVLLLLGFVVGAHG